MHEKELINMALVAASIAERDGFRNTASALLSLAHDIQVATNTRRTPPEEQLFSVEQLDQVRKLLSHSN